MADDIASGRKDKPEFDEQTLAKLLEAAYVLQEHNRELEKMELREPRGRQIEAHPQVEAHPSGQGQTAAAAKTAARSANAAKDDYTAILAQIVEVQHQIQVRRLALDAALALIVDRIVEITHAAGAGIGILDGGTLRYRAAGGLLTLPRGTDVPLEKALCAASLRVGDVIRCADVNPEFLIDAAECRRRGIQSLICVPVYHDGKTAGGLEVYYANINAFTEPDVHSCQLMAGLVTEALARNQEQSSKSSLAAERAVMLEALEKLKPNLAALVDSTATNTKAPTPPVVITAPPPAVQPFHCRKCGHELVAEEQFCGECGTPRSGDYEKPSMQSKVASMLSMQEAAKKNASGPGANGSSVSLDSHPDSHDGFQTSPSSRTLADVAESEMPELFRLPDSHPAKTDTGEIAEPSFALTHLHAEGVDVENNSETENANDEASQAETALVKSDANTPWTSAAAAREFLERLAGRKPDPESSAFMRFLSARRGDVYLVLAVILVACVIRWGIWSNHSVSATGNSAAAAAHHKSDADLPFFDRLLIKLGLAEAPDAPEEKGNPDVQVWVDLHTGLYYCPGSDPYGKSPKGKYETQHDAQLDQFEPASRKACP